MEKTVNPYRFIGGITKRMLQNWVKMETPRPSPVDAVGQAGTREFAWP